MMNFWNISYPDLNNGLGCRATLWVAGCTHHCKGCQNAQTWDFKSGRPFTDVDKHKLMEVLSKPYIKGLTLSGGDPMDNYDDILLLVKEIKQKLPQKDIWLYTGYTLEQLISLGKDEILDYIDVLVDGEFHIDERDISLKFRGSKNQIIWEKDTKGSFIRSKLND